MRTCDNRRAGGEPSHKFSSQLDLLWAHLEEIFNNSINPFIILV